MELSEKIILEKYNNNIIGVFGYIKYNSNKYKFRKYLYKKQKNILINSWFIKDKEAMHTYPKNYSYTPNYLENYFDGEISIIIVDKNYRNLKISKKINYGNISMRKRG